MAGEMVPAVAWIVDGTGFPKQGKPSVGVARQYSGTLGNVGNCQIAVSLNLATAEVCMPVGFDLYLPKARTDDSMRM
jgi:SRSO17 transposase